MEKLLQSMQNDTVVLDNTLSKEEEEKNFKRIKKVRLHKMKFYFNNSTV